MHLFALILLFCNSTTSTYIRTNWVRATNTQKSISGLILKVWVKIAFPLPLQRQKYDLFGGEPQPKISKLSSKMHF